MAYLTQVELASTPVPDDASLLIFCRYPGILPNSIPGIDAAQKSELLDAMVTLEFKGSTGTVKLIPGIGLGRKFIVIAGCGELENQDMTTWDRLGAGIANSLDQMELEDLYLINEIPDSPPLSSDQIARLIKGIQLRSYRYNQHKRNIDTEKSDEKTGSISTLYVHALSDDETPEQFRESIDRALVVARGVNTTRDLVNSPPNILSPEALSKEAMALTELGVNVEVVSPEDMREMGMNAFTGVARGSEHPPQFVIMRWNGAIGEGSPQNDASDENPPLMIIGKGVTFDSGGISLKPSGGMQDMKADMAGAATVIGLMSVLARRNSGAHVAGVIGCAENMPAGNAIRPGDILGTSSGSTIEIVNTDAEGRLILADIIGYVRKRFRPNVIIDLATLTGAILVSLGHRHAGLFANDDALAEQLLQAANSEGEGLWRLPLDPVYAKLNESKVADIKNSGGRIAGSISAAEFLHHFIDISIDESSPPPSWAHIDIAGTAFGASCDQLSRTLATGYGVRLLDRYIETVWES